MTDFNGNDLGGAGWFLWMWFGALVLVGLLSYFFDKVVTRPRRKK